MNPRNLLCGLCLIGLFSLGSELSYQDELNAPAPEDYTAMRCAHFPGDPDCIKRANEAQAEAVTEVAAISNSGAQ